MMKGYRLDTKDDFVFYLYQLICRCYKMLKKQDLYLDRLSAYLSEVQSKNVIIATDKIDIPYNDYTDFLALLSHVETGLLNIIGDLQDSSLSYYKFRNIVAKRKKKGILHFEVSDISEEVLDILKRFNSHRNFQNHIPESLITSEAKLMDTGKLTEIELNPCAIWFHEFCTLEFVDDMYQSYKDMNRQAYIVFNSMKVDIECLLGHKFVIIDIPIKVSRGIEHLAPVKLAADIQGLH